ncbi:hypothetical protein PT85_06565 [Pseudomonas flexibilis]|uniref:Uncharacterized protein n=1 Tax=Pseudomonas flexibilis TaxID=706570 RepID=A0A0B3BMM7_9PSED|nr:hypothetical protein PT85_06565 [Pseudomonas flexibilis]
MCIDPLIMLLTILIIMRVLPIGLLSTLMALISVQISLVQAIYISRMLGREFSGLVVLSMCRVLT